MASRNIFTDITSIILVCLFSFSKIHILLDYVCRVLTLKEFCENFYQKVQDLIMIITNFIHLFVADLWATFFPSLFYAIFQPVACAASSGCRWCTWIQIRKLFLQDPNKKKL